MRYVLKAIRRLQTVLRPQRGQDRAEPSLVICAVAYNEAPYVMEWVAHHLGQGVRHFHIGDNESDDGTSGLLECLQRLGLVTRVYVPRCEQGNIQRAFYSSLLKKLAGESVYVAFLDLDEFLVPESPERTADEIIKELLEPEPVGAVALNWRIFGSSGRLQAGAGLVGERFLECARSDAMINHHVKSVVKPMAATGTTAHRVKLKPRYRYVDALGDRYPFDETSGYAPDHPVRHLPICVHHYVVKSYQEFVQRKMSRGRATQGSSSNRGLEFFHRHDFNQAECTQMLQFTEQTKSRMRELEAQLAGIPAFSAKISIDWKHEEGGGNQLSLESDRALGSPAVVVLDRSVSDAHRHERRILVNPVATAAKEGHDRSSAHRYCARVGLSADAQSVLLRLEYSPQPINAISAVRDSSPASRMPTGQTFPKYYTGRIDQIDSRQVSGWARGFEDEKPVEVDLLFGGRVVASTLADHLHLDALARGCHPTGFCGFRFDLTTLPNMLGTKLRCKVRGSATLLPISKVTSHLPRSGTIQT